MPQSTAGPISQHDALEYLESLEDLARELDKAVEAVTDQALPSFEKSLQNQRLTCARLAEVAARRNSYTPGEDIVPIDAELAGRIKAAATTLIQLNQRYSALLKHSGDTMRLFSSLFRTYSGPALQSVPTPPSHNTWSCEL